jgi:hypothetical protein
LSPSDCRQTKARCGQAYANGPEALDLRLDQLSGFLREYLASTFH